MPSVALNGLRVLDMSRVLAAPLATQWLADLGAEVIKVERPGTGDESRTYGPPFAKDQQGNDTSTAAFYLSCNRNKRSISINHATEEGQNIIRRLVRESDILVENFRAGVLKKYDLDYESLKQENPGLIYLSITGFGQTGPYAQRPGYDGVFQAMSGMMSASGHPEEPMKMGVSMVDILTSLYASTALLAAVRHRDKTGEGQYIDLSLLDCGLASLSHFAMNYLISGEVPERRGNGGYGGVPSQAFACKDKPIFIVAGNDKQFAALCKAINQQPLAADNRFCSTATRIQHRSELLAILDEVFRSRDRDSWLEKLEAAGVPASPINEISEAMGNPQIQHREMVIDQNPSYLSAYRQLANPIKFSATPVGEYGPPPGVGEHTRDILKELIDADDMDIDALYRKGVI
jgi:crotonobetainyl-CoA:carnitine CoA-transferase CaiB-like acyl-CoA transferase